MRKQTAVVVLGMLVSGFTAQAQVTIYQASDAASFGAWTFADVDGDTYNWEVHDVSTVSGLSAQGDAIRSFSSDPSTFNPLNPDNFAIAPPFDLVGYSNVSLLWDRASASAVNYGEHYAVYVVSANSQVELMTALATASPVFEETLTVGQTLQEGTVDLSAFEGMSNLYVVFRHYNCSGQYFLVIDDVKVKGDIAAGVTNLENNARLLLSPNPVQDQLNIVCNEPVESVQIVDQSGRRVVLVLTSVNGELQLDCSAIDPGVYILQVVTASGRQLTERFVR